MIVFFSLGSNRGHRKRYIEMACHLIEDRVGTIKRRSRDYFSMPWGYESSHEYLNIAIQVETPLSARAVLLTTQAIERELGRTVKNHYEDRTIDIDIILCYDDKDQLIRISEPDLVVPHPLMRDRDFVMIPLAEIIAPDLLTSDEPSR